MKTKYLLLALLLAAALLPRATMAQTPTEPRDTDPCGIATFPWKEDFNAYSNGSYFTPQNGPCWAFQDLNNTGRRFQVENGHLYLPHGNPNGLLNGTYASLRLPQLTLPSENYAFSFDIYREAETTGRVEVFVSPNGSIDNLEPLLYISARYNYNGGQYDSQTCPLVPPESGAGWYTYSVNIPCSGSCYIVLRCYADAAGQSFTPRNLYLDNFSIREVPSDLAVSNITSSTADISWMPATDETDWIVQYGPYNSFYNGTFQQVNVTGDPSVTLASLDPVQRYHVRVKAVYGSENSGWSLPLSFDMASRYTVGRLSTFYEYLPIKCYNAYTYSQQIFTSAELGDAGTIRSVEFYRTEKSPCNRNLDVYMVYTDKEAFASNTDWISVTTANRVFSGTINFSGDDWTVIELATPFEYDGQHNVAIIVDDNTGTHQKATYFNAFTTNTNQTCSRSPYDSNVNPSDPGTGYMVAGKNQIRILKDYPSPTDLHCITLNSTSATLDWTENGTADTWQICINDDENNLISVYSTTYTLSGLAIGSTYTIKVRAKCDRSNLFSGWSDPISVTPSEKIVIGSGSVNNNYLPIDNYYNYSLTQQIYTAAELGAAGIIYSIDFYKNNAGNCTRNMNIYMVNTNKNTFESTSDWISVTSGDLVFSGWVVFANNDWTTIELSVPFAYDGTSNVAFVVDDNTGSWNYYTPFLCFNTSANQAIYYYNDDNNYDPTGTLNSASDILAQKNYIRLFKDETSCPKPSNLSLVGFTDTTTTLSWLEIGEATAWQICLNDDEAHLIEATENPYTLTGLVAETTYTAKVRAHCGDAHSEWSTPLSFRPTPKTIIGSGSLTSYYLPTSSINKYSLTQQIYTAAELGDAGFVYNIDFFKTDDYTSNRILDIYMTNTTKSAFQSTSDWISVATENLVFSDTVSFAHNDWTTIELDIPFNYDGTSNVVVVVVDKTGNASSSTSFLTFGTIDAQALYINSNTSYNPTSGNIPLGTRLNTKNQIRLLKGEAPSCPIPIGLTLVSSTCTTATLRWTEKGEATAWQICLNDDETTLIDVTENPYVLTGLVTDSTYTAKVRANCGDEQSGWSYPISFTPINKVVVGSGSASSNYLPTNNFYNYSLTQQIYTAAELGGAGLIQSIGFYKNSADQINRTVNIYMVNTNKSAFESTTDWIGVTSDDLVFSGTINFADNDWSTIELSVPFEYDGTSNVAILVDDNTGAYDTTIPFLCFDALTNQAIYFYSDDNNYDPIGGTPGGALEVMTMKNQIRLFITPHRPTHLTCSAVTAGSVTLNWTENGEASAWQICLNDDETHLIEATGNPFTVTDLVGASDYTVKVRSNYGYIQSAWSDPVSFSTPCGIATFPWKEDFNAYSNGSYFTPQNGPCWAYQDLNNTYRRFRVENGALCLPHGEDSGVLNGTTCTLRLPELTLPSDNYAFSFDVYRESSTKGEVKVYVSQTGSISNLEPLVYISTQYNYNGGYYSNDPSVIVPPENASGWYTYSVNIPYSGSCYVILYCESDWAGQNYTPKNLYLDNFSIREVPSDLAVSNITSTTADISWTPATDETEWIVQYGPYNSFYNGTFQQVTVTGNPSVTLGLDPVLRYHVRVKAVYGSEKSGWSLPLSFDMTPRHTVGRLSTFYAYLPIKCYNYYTYSQQIYTPAELGDVGTIRSIDFFRDDTSPCNRNLDVYMVYTDKEAFESNTDWISVTTNNRVFSGTVNFSAQDWTAIELSQPFSYDGLNNVAIIVHDKTGVHQQSSYFYGIGANTNQTCIRSTYDSSINPSSPGQGSLVAGKNQIRILKDYPTLTNLVCTAITTTTATIDWTENGSADTWQICLNDDESNLITVYSYNKPYTLTGLTHNTDYTIKVRAKCDNSCYSAWSDACSFSTIATPPYSTDFETTCGWMFLNGNLENVWTWGEAAHNGTGTHGLYISNDGGTSNAYNNNSSTMVYAYKTFNFEAGVYNFSYDWLAKGEGSFDYLRVALVPDSLSLAAGTTKPSDFGTSTLPEGWIALDGGSQLSRATEWQTANYDIEVTTAGIYKMVFAWRNDDSDGTNPPAAIDNVSIEPTTCPIPVNLTISNVFATSVDLGWTTLIPTDGYTVKYRSTRYLDAIFSEGFENGIGDWTLRNCKASTGVIGISSAHSGNSVFCYYYNTNPPQYLISPELTGVAEGMMLEFYYKNSGTEYPETFQIGFSATDNENASFTFGDEITANDGQWHLYSEHIPAGTKYICWKYTSYDQNYLYIDDIVVGTEVPVSEWQTANVAGGSNEVNTTLAGLTPETPYEAYVYPDCNPDRVSETVNFTTEESCPTPRDPNVSDIGPVSVNLNWMGISEVDSYTVKYKSTHYLDAVFSEGFENGIGDWTMNNCDNNTGISNGKHHTGQQAFRFYYNTTPPQYLISPELTGVTDGMKLEFYYNNESSSWPETFQVGFSTTDNATDSFTFGDEITASDVQWHLYSETIPAGTKYICWKLTSNDKYYLFIDDIAVGTEIPAGEWQTATVAGGSLQVSATLSGLTPETPYEAYVYPDCDPNKVSETITFTTLEQTSVTQTIALSAGVNWVSFYVETNLADLKESLKTALNNASGIKIKTQNNGYTNWNGTSWRGNITAFNLGQMFMIEVPAACEISLEGMPIDPAEYPVTIVTGQNWIGYPLNTEMTVANAFAGFAINGDKLKSQNNGYTQYTNGWRGQLRNLVPGQGYIYNSSATESRTLIFPTSAK